MDGIQYGYDELINAVFEEAYDNLVKDYKRAKQFHQLARQEYGEKMIEAEENAKDYAGHALYLEEWFTDVLPCWRNIAPDRIIKRAREEADGINARAVGQSAVHSRFNREVRW